MHILCLVEYSPFVEHRRLTASLNVVNRLLLEDDVTAFAVFKSEVMRCAHFDGQPSQFPNTEPCDLITILKGFKYFARTLVCVFTSGTQKWTEEAIADFVLTTPKNVSFDIHYLNDTHAKLEFMRTWCSWDEFLLRVPFALIIEALTKDLKRW